MLPQLSRPISTKAPVGKIRCLPPRGIPTRLEAVSKRLTLHIAKVALDAQVAELNERYERSIKWLTPDLPNYNGMCDHIAENVLCAYEVSQIFKRTMGTP
jgi:hypothetical protein